MKQVKDEADRNKQSEARRNKEVAQLKREQLAKENRIRNLEKEKKQKETVLKRQVEEVWNTLGVLYFKLLVQQGNCIFTKKLCPLTIFRILMLSQTQNL